MPTSNVLPATIDRMILERAHSHIAALAQCMCRYRIQTSSTEAKSFPLCSESLQPSRGRNIHNKCLAIFYNHHSILFPLTQIPCGSQSLRAGGVVGGAIIHSRQTTPRVPSFLYDRRQPPRGGGGGQQTLTSLNFFSATHGYCLFDLPQVFPLLS